MIARGLNLDDPKQARKYVLEFDWSGLSEAPTFVITSEGREIHFDRMTDQDAVDLAHILFRDIECAVESLRAKAAGRMQ